MDKLKISTIVGNLVKADQAKVKLDSPINHGGPLNDDDIIVINVGGVRHETQISTLLKKPETRLYSVAEAAKAQGKREFYFDRNPQMFPSILNYYRIGKLHMPSDVCGPAAKAELDYWELEDKDIEQCCWVNYISYEETLDMLEKFEADERNKFYSVYVSPNASLFTKLKPRVWRAVQDPYSSRNALAYAVLSLTLVLLSIVVFVIETLPYFGSVFVQATKFNKNITSDDLRNEMKIFTDITPNDVLLLIDNACNIFFFIEFIIKLIASPDKRKFFKSPLVIIELLALVPYYIAIFVVLFHPDPKSVFMIIRVLFATRVLRIFRIFVLMKHFLALKILIFTIRASTKELFLLLIVLLIGVVIFACLEYYMEIFSDYDSHFTHIPLAFWWALITMTTVGYGDVYPQTGLGYAIGGFCAISGVLVIALSVPVIVNNFTVYYSHAQSREKLKMRKRKFEQTEKWQRLRAGLKSKLKNGTLKGLINSARKKYGSDSSNGGPALKFSLLKHRGGGGASSRGFRAASRIRIPEPASEIESDVPSTARDVVLEEFTTADELSDGGRAGISMISDSVELSSSRSPSNGSGSNLLPEDDRHGSRPGVKKKNGLSVVRSKFFANGVKPKIVTRRTKSTEIHPLKTVTPKRIVKR